MLTCNLARLNAEMIDVCRRQSALAGRQRGHRTVMEVTQSAAKQGKICAWTHTPEGGMKVHPTQRCSCEGIVWY